MSVGAVYRPGLAGGSWDGIVVGSGIGGLAAAALLSKAGKRVLDNVYRHVPQIRGRIACHEISTPLSTRHFANYTRGEIYGIDHTPDRFRLSWLRPHTPLRGLFLTGQDIVTDGVGGALMAGVLTASAVLRRNVLRDVARRTG